MSCVLIFSDKDNFYEEIQWNSNSNYFYTALKVFSRKSSEKKDLVVVDLSVDDGDDTVDDGDDMPSTAGLNK